MTKIPPDDVLESLFKLRIRVTDQLKTVLELYDMEIHQKISKPNHQKLKNDGEEKYGSETSITKFDARNERNVTEAYSGELHGCLYLARIGRPHILWSVNKIARAVNKWTRACDRLLARLISYIHHTSDFKQYCHVGNTAQQCRLGLFQDSDFAGDP